MTQPLEFDRKPDVNQIFTYKPGSIKSIKLTNFMCHESFELNLGPRVNFVIGPNGSGKSALLTAIVVALGGRATVTSRAKRADEFVMYGKNTAKVTIVLHNYDKIMEKDQAFKPDDYGKFIVIERTISKNDAGTKLALKNDSYKKISERKQEMDEMLEHFSILINNPICILNQEISKTFLHSKRPEDKFELFMKATNLEQIEEDYQIAQKSHKEWKLCNESKTFSYKMLDGEYKSCREKLSLLENRANLNERLNTLNGEVFWALTRDNEAISAKAKEKLDAVVESIKQCKNIVENRTNKIKNQEDEILAMREKINTIQEKLKESHKKFQDAKTKELHLNEKQITLQTKVTAYLNKIKRLRDGQLSIEKAITDLKEQFRNQNDLDQDNEQRKLEIEKLEKEDIPRENAREKSIRNHSDQLHNSMSSTRADVHSANEKVSAIQNKISQNIAMIKRLKAGQQSQIRKYGDFMIKILEEIDIVNKQGRFKHKPLGPLGACLKLKDQDIAAPLEHILGRNAHAFVCDNMEDMAVLNTILKKQAGQRDYRQPAIIVRRFTSRHDVSRFKAFHPTYKTILDYIDIENDAVYNCLVDRCSLESVLFIPEYREAERIMIDQASVPAGTRSAYTKDCSVMYPRSANSGYRAFSNSTHGMVLFTDSNVATINQAERELSQLEALLREADRKASKFNDQLEAQKREYEANENERREILHEIRKKEERLLTLKTTIAKEPQELSALEEELESTISSIGEEEIKLNQEKSKLQTIESELNDIKIERKEIKNIVDRHEKERKGIQDDIDKCNDTISKFKEESHINLSLIKNRQKEKLELEQKYEETLRQVTLSQQQAGNSRRPRNLRPTADIREDIRKIEVQLKVQEEDTRDPSEVITSLNKRMIEIEHLNKNKDHNLDNFNLTSKCLAERKAGFQRLRDSTIHGVGTTFTTVMRTMKMNGELDIHVEPLLENGVEVKKARTLHMRIETNYTPSQRPTTSVMSDNASNSQPTRSGRSSNSVNIAAPSRPKRARTESGNDRDSGASEKENGDKMTDSRSLSGGERSFSTVAFVLALWHHCHSPFKLMDEIDVFMDMVTRRQSYTALIRFAQVQEEPGQFIFFSPLELPKFDDSGNFVHVYEMPCIIRSITNGEDVPMD